jgi:hypothetical protein
MLPIHFLFRKEVLNSHWPEPDPYTYGLSPDGAPDLADYPNISIRNVRITGQDRTEATGYELPLREAPIMIEHLPTRTEEVSWEFVNKYKFAIENLTIVNLAIKFEYLARLLTNMDSLKNLRLDNVQTEYSYKSCSRVNIRTLESLSIDFVIKNYNLIDVEQTFNLFKGNDSITNLQLTVRKLDQDYRDINVKSFLEFMETLPNVKHLTLKGPNIDELLNKNLSSKLETLNTVSLDTDVKFLQRQKETLRELRLEKLPSSRGSAVIVRAIFEGLHLQTFYLKNQALILYSEKQHAEDSIEFGTKDSAIESVLELLKHGRCKFKIRFKKN